jgi:hypothetical protein
MSKPVELLDIGVDWLTGTTSDRERGSKLGMVAVDLMRKEEVAGCRPKSWGMAGYQGWSTGSVQTGERDDSIILRLGSVMARSHWRLAFNQCDGVSRLDCQYTIRSGLAPAKLIAKHYRAAKAHLGRNLRPGTVSLFTSSDGSSTLYLGKRSSEQFGRIYDKGSESGLKEYEGAVRYEVEFKGSRAQQVADLLYLAREEFLEVSVRVSTFFESRGVIPPLPSIDSQGNPLPSNFCFPSDLAALPRMPTDLERRLIWLGKAVAPFAIDLVSQDKGSLLLKTLGLYVEYETGELRVLNHNADSKEVG